VNDILAAVVTHGAILLFLYVLADQLGVPVFHAVRAPTAEQLQTPWAKIAYFLSEHAGA
jgi:hypothetical protein